MSKARQRTPEMSQDLSHGAGAAGAAWAPHSNAAVIDALSENEAVCAGPVSGLPMFGLIQQAFGAHSLDGVHVRTGGAPEQPGLQAMTEGDQVDFMGSIDLWLAAHEAAHVVQQRHGVQPQGVQARAQDPWEVQADKVADRVVQGRSAEELLDGLPGTASPHAVSPFRQAYGTGEHVQLGDGAEGAELLTVDVGPPGSKTVKVSLTSGELNALGDFYGSPEAILGADPGELQTLLCLIRREKARPGSVTSSEWEAATGGRYTELARNNDAHFAPSNDAILGGTAGDSSANNAGTWEGYHRAALGLAMQATDPTRSADDRASLTTRAKVYNEFGTHFLEDGFSAGHLFNKADFMAQAESNMEALDEGARGALLTQVAHATFEPNREVIGEYYMLDTWQIDEENDFQTLLVRIQDARPDVVYNALAKGAHDTLNASGVEVENDLHQGAAAWIMSGDDHLNETSSLYCQEAIAAARENLDQALSAGTGMDINAAVARIRGLFPRPTSAGVDTVKKAVGSATDMQNGGAAEALVGVINREIRTIMDAVAAEKALVWHKGPEDPPSLPSSCPAPEDPAKEVDDTEAQTITVTGYTVKEGDTLTGIAMQFYGSPDYTDILNTNPKIVDPNHIEVGWVLTIPHADGP